MGCGVHVDPYSNKLLKDGHIKLNTDELKNILKLLKCCDEISVVK